MHEASQIVVGVGSGGLSGLGEDGIGMYLGSKEAWVLGSHFWLDALGGGQLGSKIGLDAEEAGNWGSRIFRAVLTACQAGGTGGGRKLKFLSSWSATC